MPSPTSEQLSQLQQCSNPTPVKVLESAIKKLEDLHSLEQAEHRTSQNPSPATPKITNCFLPEAIPEVADLYTRVRV